MKKNSYLPTVYGQALDGFLLPISFEMDPLLIANRDNDPLLAAVHNIVGDLTVVYGRAPDNYHPPEDLLGKRPLDAHRAFLNLKSGREDLGRAAVYTWNGRREPIPILNGSRDSLQIIVFENPKIGDAWLYQVSRHPARTLFDAGSYDAWMNTHEHRREEPRKIAEEGEVILLEHRV